MDAGFRGKIECVLHFIEGGRHAGLFHSFMNEEKQFLLFAREHEENTLENRSGSRETNTERTLYVPYVFCNPLKFREAAICCFDDLPHCLHLCFSSVRTVAAWDWPRRQQEKNNDETRKRRSSRSARAGSRNR
ncbi:hypothetical protein [Rhizobium oryzihabitans]|uniref:hypothetical protein n=1 Tax=Rhizobium oryzihabitans TaxID=2267833 RepID=UPI001FEC3A00|nr:hypothetical protein [Rhizobium oryzihabitans]